MIFLLVQLQILTMKKGAVSPFYLHLACETLRNFASFDKVTVNITFTDTSDFSGYTMSCHCISETLQ